MATKKKTSALWDFFTCLDDVKSKCNICKQVLSHRTSVTNLKRHMNCKHPTVHVPWRDAALAKPIASRQTLSLTLADNDDTQAVQRPADSMTSIETTRSQLLSGQGQVAEVPPLPKRAAQRQTQLTSFAQRPLSKSQKEQADKHLIEMFTRSFHAFNLVNEEPFQNLLHSLNSSYQIPSRTWISRTALPFTYEQCRVKIEEMVQEAKSVCITTDCWTSRNINSFCAVTAHYIDNNFKLVSVLLDCSNMDISHTANNLANELKAIVSSFQLDQKIALAVSDNAANIKKAIELLRWKHLGCLAHTINLIVLDGLKSNSAVKEVLQKVKSIVTFFRKSPTNHKMVLNYQISQGVQTPLKLKNESPTRWNSTLYMVERFVQLEYAVKTSIALVNTQLPSWKMLKDLCKILKPWESATTTLSGELYQTASIVIALVEGLSSINCKIISMDLQPDVLAVANSFSFHCD